MKVYGHCSVVSNICKLQLFVDIKRKGERSKLAAVRHTVSVGDTGVIYHRGHLVRNNASFIQDDIVCGFLSIDCIFICACPLSKQNILRDAFVTDQRVYFHRHVCFGLAELVRSQRLYFYPVWFYRYCVAGTGKLGAGLNSLAHFIFGVPDLPAVQIIISGVFTLSEDEETFIVRS